MREKDSTDAVEMTYIEEVFYGRPAWNLAEKIVVAICSELEGRRGLGFDCVDEETARELGETLAGLVREVLEAKP